MRKPPRSPWKRLISPSKEVWKRNSTSTDCTPVINSDGKQEVIATLPKPAAAVRTPQQDFAALAAKPHWRRLEPGSLRTDPNWRKTREGASRAECGERSYPKRSSEEKPRSNLRREAEPTTSKEKGWTTKQGRRRAWANKNREVPTATLPQKKRQTARGGPRHGPPPE